MTNPDTPHDAELPIRVRLRRTKGWRLPPNTVSVARPTKFGNPFRADEDMNVAGAVAAYRAGIAAAARRGLGWTGWAQRIIDSLPELRGKNLACWCPAGQPCHADVLLELANPAIAMAPDRAETLAAPVPQDCQARPSPKNHSPKQEGDAI